MTRQLIGEVVDVHRIGNTVKGNPRWRVTIDQITSDGRGGFRHTFTTQGDSDSMLVVSKHAKGRMVEIRVERSITITHFRFLSDSEVRSIERELSISEINPNHDLN